MQGVLSVPRRRVRFAKHVTVYKLPYDDRRSPWMTVAADRCRFERRIELTENILRDVLLCKKMDKRCMAFTSVNMTDS